MSDNITEINKNTFWVLIAQAKQNENPERWLINQLKALGPERARTFDAFSRIYMNLAYQYGLWTAASVMEKYGCSDDGFIDFRGWLVGQGRDVYLNALKDPDSLADILDYHDSQYDTIAYMGSLAYEELTGEDAFPEFDPDMYHTLTEELKQDIVYGPGINYPYKWSEAASYLPKLCAKYLTPEDLKRRVQQKDDMWNTNSPDIRQARNTALNKAQKSRGDAR